MLLRISPSLLLQLRSTPAGFRLVALVLLNLRVYPWKLPGMLIGSSASRKGNLRHLIKQDSYHLARLTDAARGRRYAVRKVVLRQVVRLDVPKNVRRRPPISE